jgi:PAS domain S-box-containing protein
MASELEILRRENAELRAKLDFFESLSTNLPDFQIVIDRQFRIAYVNRVPKDLDPKEIIGANAILLTHPDDQEKLSNTYNQVFNTGKSAVSTIRSLKGPGIFTRYSFSIGPLFIKGSSDFDRLVINAQDMSDNWLTHEYYNYFWDNSPMMMHAIDHNGRITHVSRKWLETLQYSSEEVIGKRSVEFLAREHTEEGISAIRNIISGGEPTLLPTVFLKKDGERVEVEIYANGISNASGETEQVYAILMDVTDRNRKEAALQVALDKAVASERAKSNFLAVVNHELRTPLTSILSAAELINGELTKAGETNLQIIKKSGSHLLQLINEVLTLSKMEANQVELIRMKFNRLRKIRGTDHIAPRGRYPQSPLWRSDKD